MRSIVRALKTKLIAAAVLILSAAATPARADLILDVIAEPSSAAAGQPGTFDIVVQDDSTSTESVSIGGFSVDVTVAPGSGVTFTGIDAVASTSYIFDGNSLGFSGTSTEDVASGNDFAATGGTELTPGGMAYTLARVSYSIDPGATPGSMIPVSFVLPGDATSLSDADGDLLVFTPTAGTITVMPGGAVPEPSSLVLISLAGVAILGTRYRAGRSLGSDR